MQTKKIYLQRQGIAFDGKGFWSFDEDITKNVLIFGVNNSSSSLLIIQKVTFSY